MEPGPSGIRKAWSDAAHLFFNTAVLFVVVNLVIGFGCNLRDQPAAPAGPAGVAAPTPPPVQGRPAASRWRTAWQFDHIDMDAYGDASPAMVNGMLDDMTRFANLGVTYEPWVQFGPPRFQSDSVNVEGAEDEFLVRRSVAPARQTGLSPVRLGGRAVTVSGTGAGSQGVEVYLFGGSTTFGWDTADQWTLGTALWQALQQRYPGQPIHLVNYGRPLYFSSQEVELFLRLLKTGHRPAVAIFVDGLNDVFQLSYQRDQPWLTPRVAGLLHHDQLGRNNDLENWQWIPLVKLAFILRHRFGHAPPSTAVAMDSSETPAPPVTRYVLEVCRQNRKLAREVAQADGVRTWFFWQPCPFVAYDRSLHRNFPPMSDRNLAVYQGVYDAMKHDPEVVYLGDLAQAWGRRKVYVDDVHYGPDFTRFMAERMAQSIDLAGSQAGAPK